MPSPLFLILAFATFIGFCLACLMTVYPHYTRHEAEIAWFFVCVGAAISVLILIADFVKGG